MIIGTTLGIITLLAFGWFLFKNSKAKNPVTLNQLLEERADETFKVLGALGTFIEVINLSLISMKEQEMDMFQAMSRYGLIGVMEVLMTWLFISVISNSLKQAAKDNKITFKEFFMITMKALPVFFIGVTVTSYIHVLYLESLYQIEFQQGPPLQFLIFYYPIATQIMVTNPDDFMLIDFDQMRSISGASVFLIYTTPFFNLLLVILQWRKVTKEMKARRVNQEEEYIDDEDDEDEDEDDEPVGLDLYGAIKHLKDILHWNPDKILNNLKDVLGENGIVTSTHPEIRNGSKTPSEIEKWLSNLIVGDDDEDDPIGVLGYLKFGNKINEAKADLDSVIEEIDDINQRISNVSLTSQLDSLEKEKKELEESKVKIRQQIKKFSDTQDDIKKTLEKFCKQAGLKP